MQPFSTYTFVFPVFLHEELEGALLLIGVNWASEVKTTGYCGGNNTNKRNSLDVGGTVDASWTIDAFAGLEKQCLFDKVQCLPCVLVIK